MSLSRGSTNTTVDGGAANPKDLTDLRDRELAVIVQPLRRADLLTRELWGPAALPASGAGGGEARGRALGDQVSLELGERAEDVEDEPTTGGSDLCRGATILDLGPGKARPVGTAVRPKDSAQSNELTAPPISGVARWHRRMQMACARGG